MVVKTRSLCVPCPFAYVKCQKRLVCVFLGFFTQGSEMPFEVNFEVCVKVLPDKVRCSVSGGRIWRIQRFLPPRVVAIPSTLLPLLADFCEVQKLWTALLSLVLFLRLIAEGLTYRSSCTKRQLLAVSKLQARELDIPSSCQRHRLDGSWSGRQPPSNRTICRKKINILLPQDGLLLLEFNSRSLEIVLVRDLRMNRYRPHLE